MGTGFVIDPPRRGRGVKFPPGNPEYVSRSWPGRPTFFAVHESRSSSAPCYVGHMAEDYGYGYGRHRHEYDDAAEDFEAGYGDAADDADDAGYLDAADYEDYEDYVDDSVEDDAPDWDDESVGDSRFLTGPMDEPVDDVVEDPSVNESLAYERIRRIRRRAGGRRRKNWIPPDLRRFGSPVFWPAEELHGAPGPARPMPVHKVMSDILLQVMVQPLVNSAELARTLDLDEDLVKQAVRDLQKRGVLRSVSFGCLMRPTARYWVDPVNLDGAPVGEFERDVLSWHGDDGIGCLLRYDMPRVETINHVAARYATDGWELEGVVWVEWAAVQAIARYHRRGAPEIRSAVSFMWVGLLDTDQEIWRRLADLPAAVNGITQAGLSGSVALVGADRWAVTRALPLAVARLSEWQVEPADVAAWTCAAGEWQAASGASLLEGAAGQPFRPTLAPARLDGFAWSRSRRSLGRAKLASVIKSCPWTRPDARTLYQLLILLVQFPGSSIAHYAALAGRSDKDSISRQRMATLAELGLVREVGIPEVGTPGVPDMTTPDRSESLSERGRGQRRYRISLNLNREKGLEEELARLGLRQSGQGQIPPTKNGAFLVMLAHGGLSYREVVRRSGVGRLRDRLGYRLAHDDLAVDVLGRFTVMGGEVAPASRAITVNSAGRRIEPDGMLYCCSPAGTGYHYFELELSHLNPSEIRPRLRKYLLRHTSYPLLVVCRTDRGARNYDRIGRELGVPVVATSLPRLREIGLAGLAWFHRGQEVCVTPATCPPRPSTVPGAPPAA